MTTAHDRRPLVPGHAELDREPTLKNAPTPSLIDLIREEDRKTTATDPAAELRRRACPSGE